MVRTAALILASALVTSCGGEPTTANGVDATATEIDNGVFAFVIPAGVSKEQLDSWAKVQCGDQGFCKVIGWMEEDRANVATGFPMTSPEAGSMQYIFTLNRSSGLQQAQYGCDAFPDTPAEECIPRT